MIKKFSIMAIVEPPEGEIESLDIVICPEKIMLKFLRLPSADIFVIISNIRR
jgi:hypothetical protein